MPRVVKCKIGVLGDEPAETTVESHGGDGVVLYACPDKHPHTPYVRVVFDRAEAERLRDYVDELIGGHGTAQPKHRGSA